MRPEVPKGTATQGLILKWDQGKGIKCYMDYNFFVIWNQEEGNDHGLVLSRMDNITTYANCLIIWANRLHTEIALSTMEVEYISLSESMGYVLPFVVLMK